MNENIILNLKEEFQKIIDYVQGEAQSQQIHEVEKTIFSFLLQLGLLLLSLFIEKKGDGNVGEMHTDSEGVKRNRHKTKKKKIYFSIFGKIEIKRAYYWLKGFGGLCPLDAELNLPETSYSYFIREWASLLGVRGAYNKVMDIFKNMFCIDLWNRPLEDIMNRASEGVKNFYEEKPAPAAEEEGEIIVATVDNKGVPLKKEEEKNKKKIKRLKKGEKNGKKKMSTVTAVYSIDKNKRTVEDIVKDVMETDSKEETKEQGSKSDKPKPKNKIERATLEGKKEAFEEMNKEVEKRDPECKKERVALVDGEHKLRKLIILMLKNFCIIIDIFHVLEYVWLAAHVFYDESSEEAEKWVRSRLELLLKGKVACIITSLKYSIANDNLTPSKIKTLKKVVTYLENGQEYMKYDIYIEKGYPIGSGVIEGACRNLVKDRMEATGMKWSINGAEAVLQMRSVDINGNWEEYWNFKINKEYNRLYENYVNNYNTAA